MPQLHPPLFAAFKSWAGACAVALLVAGCGGGREERPDTPVPTPTASAPSVSATPPQPPAGGPADAGGGAAPASPYLSAQAGDVLAVKIRQLHPTQPAVGYDQIYYHLGRKQPDPNRYAPGAAGYQGDVEGDNYSRYLYRTDRKRIDDYCADNGQGGVDDRRYVPLKAHLIDASTFACTDPVPSRGSAAAQQLKTVVVGPGGVLYLTDGHHTMTVLRELADGGPELTVWVRVAANFADAADAATFWSQMQARHYVWLQDADQRPVRPEDLPAEVGLAQMQDDPYRSLVYFTRGLGYSNAGLSEFAEFYWASGLRKRGFGLSGYHRDDLSRARIEVDAQGVRPRPGDSTDSYVAAVRDAALRMVALSDTDEVDGGRSAAELGRLNPPSAAKVWNDAMEDELWRADVNSSGAYRTAGKAWYAQRYRVCGPAAGNPGCWARAH